ncbi:hypothetical protein V1498_12430 [Peribacillus sp. SCS-26]|uniref:hypothetical protein n=1 Tax=Paraperibacillus marinus TaxID=3115295 RepID=UPI003905A608
MSKFLRGVLKIETVEENKTVQGRDASMPIEQAEVVEEILNLLEDKGYFVGHLRGVFNQTKSEE